VGHRREGDHPRTEVADPILEPTRGHCSSLAACASGVTRTGTRVACRLAGTGTKSRSRSTPAAELPQHEVSVIATPPSESPV
jgi:hypothetical protein